MKDIRLIHGPGSQWRRLALREIGDMVDHREQATASGGVLKELPPGLVEGVMPWGVREAWGYVEGEFMCLHHCHQCRGWIAGEASEVKVQVRLREGPVNGAMDGGADRSVETSVDRSVVEAGISYRCKRCGGEIAFLAAA